MHSICLTSWVRTERTEAATGAFDFQDVRGGIDTFLCINCGHVQLGGQFVKHLGLITISVTTERGRRIERDGLWECIIQAVLHNLGLACAEKTILLVLQWRNKTKVGAEVIREGTSHFDKVILGT